MLAANTLLRPIVHWINREPLDPSVEGTNVIYVIEAMLATTSVDRDEMDAVVKRLTAAPLISQAFWSPRTHD